jgi:hypothetical protein
MDAVLDDPLRSTAELGLHYAEAAPPHPFDAICGHPGSTKHANALGGGEERLIQPGDGSVRRWRESLTRRRPV